MKVVVYKGRKESLMAGVKISRSLPNPKMKAIGSVVFLDHVLEKQYESSEAKMPDGSFAHPHRGIATFSYLLSGGVHHIDSAGGEGKIYEGGIQWMNAGNGIVHDEFLPYDFQESGGMFHALQFWLNLPSKQKAEKPSYLAIPPESVPVVELPNQAGEVRVLLGTYKGQTSEVPSYLGQVIYHIRLKAGHTISFQTTSGWEYGIYVIKGAIKLEGPTQVSEKEIATLSEVEQSVDFKNESGESVDFMFIGGEPYSEPISSYGPFIMNSEKEIAMAYSDFQDGKYGVIDYSKVEL